MLFSDRLSMCLAIAWFVSTIFPRALPGGDSNGSGTIVFALTGGAAHSWLREVNCGVGGGDSSPPGIYRRFVGVDGLSAGILDSIMWVKMDVAVVDRGNQCLLT